MAERPRIPGGRQIRPEDFRQHKNPVFTREERARKLLQYREQKLASLAPHLPEHREFMQKAVGVLNQIIEMERSRLGLPDGKGVVTPLIPQQFLLTTVNHPGYIGAADQIDGTSNLSLIKMRFGSPEFFRVLMHEGIHLMDATKFGYGQNPYVPRASGYEQTVQGRGAFRPFYEAVLEDYACDLMRRYRYMIEPIIIAQKNTYVVETRGVYKRERDIYGMVVSRIASKDDVSHGEVRQRFRKGLFTGAFMPLRDIERACGRGTLRVLSAMDTFDEDSSDSLLQYRNVERFLTAEEDARFAIGKDIMARSGPMDLGRYVDRFYDPAEFSRIRQAKASDLSAKDLPALERSIGVALMFVDSFAKGEMIATSDVNKILHRMGRLFYKKILQDLEEKRRVLAPTRGASRPKRRKFLDIVGDLT